MLEVQPTTALSMRNRFASLGVSDEVLAQVIWADWSEEAGDLTAAQLLQWAARLLPEDAYQAVCEQLSPAVAQADRSARIVPLRRYG